MRSVLADTKHEIEISFNSCAIMISQFRWAFCTRALKLLQARDCMMRSAVITLCLAHLLELIFAEIYTNQWAVQVKDGEDAARDIAKKHGFVYVTKVRLSLCYFYILGYWSPGFADYFAPWICLTPNQESNARIGLLLILLFTFQNLKGLK